MSGDYFGNDCYCYNDDCNQKEWERQGKSGKRQYTVIHDFVMKGYKKKDIPKCPYCKKPMTVTANFYENC
jgi:hypothetical protein